MGVVAVIIILVRTVRCQPLLLLVKGGAWYDHKVIIVDNRLEGTGRPERRVDWMMNRVMDKEFLLIPLEFLLNSLDSSWCLGMIARLFGKERPPISFVTLVHRLSLSISTSIMMCGAQFTLNTFLLKAQPPRWRSLCYKVPVFVKSKYYKAFMLKFYYCYIILEIVRTAKAWF